MSRRKQSNPKPIKRQSDSEDGDDEMEDKMTSNEDESFDNSPNGQFISVKHEDRTPSPKVNDEMSEDQNFETKTPKEEPAPSFDSDTDKKQRQCISPSEIEFLKSINFPNDVLFLKKVGEEEAREIGRSYLVCTAIPLQQGSSIGPFLGERVSLSSIRQGDLVLQAKNETDDVSFVRVLERAGAWLSLLRPANNSSERNASVFFEGGRIWCQVIKDLDIGMEVLASFSILNDKCESEDEEKDTREEVKTPNEKLDKQTSQVKNHAALLFGCPFCGVRFSSARTLDGHLMYYCSKKPTEFPSMSQQSLTEANGEYEKDKPLDKKRKGSPITPSPSTGLKSESSTSPDTSSELDSPITKCPKTGETYKCPFCSYTADKVSSLNRHMRIHNRGGKSQNDIANITNVPKHETYCNDCNIQFSSVGTYKCHKDYYCSRRPQQRDDISENGSDNSSSPSPKHKNNFANGKMTLFDATSDHITKLNLHSFMNMETSSMIPGQTRVILAPPIVAPDSVNSLSYGMPTVIVQPVVPQSSSSTPTETPYRHSETRKEASISSEQPLDLTTPKKQLSDEDSGRKSSEQRSVTIKQEPVSPHSVSSVKSPLSVTSESPKLHQARDLNSTTPTPKPALSPAIAPPILPIQHLPFFGTKHISQVPTSVSKCVDCNIVFYKHENFLIHKKHYCSSRRTRNTSPSISSEDSNGTSNCFNSLLTNAETSRERNNSSDTDVSDKVSNKSVSPNRTPKHERKLRTPDSIKTANSVISEDFLYRFYCVPCKIKFSSSSTLRAHKEYYCPHGKDSEQSPVAKRPLEEHESTSFGEDGGNFKCDRCDSSFISTRLLKLHFCTGNSNTVPLVRCSYCDFVTQSELRLSDHMKVHLPSKAYRCTLCGYRGNTVRGMRMHGKMHVDNGEEFTDENMIEIEEPPLLPVKVGTLSENGPIDMEAELIRLKNEPYKRRRSRKSFEKSENMTIPSECTYTNACALCGQTFADLSTFAIHIRIHEIVALQAASARALKCQFCGDSSDNFDGLMKHMQMKHSDKMLQEQNHDTKLPQQSPGSVSRSSAHSSSRPNSANTSIVSNSRPNSANSVNSSGVPVNSRPYSETSPREDAPKKESVDDNEVSDVEQKVENDENLSVHEINIKKEPKNLSDDENEEQNKNSVLSGDDRAADKTPSPNSTSKGLQNHNQVTSPKSENSSSPKIKEENISQDAVFSRSLNVPLIDPTNIMPYYQLISGVGAVPIVQASLDNGSPLTVLKQGPKYCRNCDISFTYLSTYLAHKKYYCTARTPEEMESQAKA